MNITSFWMKLMSWNFLCDLILSIYMLVPILSKIWVFWNFDPWISLAKRAKNSKCSDFAQNWHKYPCWYVPNKLAETITHSRFGRGNARFGFTEATYDISELPHFLASFTKRFAHNSQIPNLLLIRKCWFLHRFRLPRPRPRSHYATTVDTYRFSKCTMYVIVNYLKVKCVKWIFSEMLVLAVAD